MNQRILELAQKQGLIHEHMTASERHDAITRFEKTAEMLLNDVFEYLNNEAARLSGLTHEDADYLALKCYDILEGLKVHYGIKNEPSN